MPTQRRCRLFLVTFSVLTAFATVTTPNSVQADEPRIFEQRIYIANDGKLDALNSRFRDHTCKLFKKHGMELIGFWVPTEGDAAKNTLIYILAYPNKEAREASWKAFLADPEWKAAYKASVAEGRLVKEVKQTFMTPTDYSDIQ